MIRPHFKPLCGVHENENKRSDLIALLGIAAAISMSDVSNFHLHTVTALVKTCPSVRGCAALDLTRLTLANKNFC